MVTKIAINGFGRIGRLVYRLAQQRTDIHVVAVNDLIAPDHLEYLLRYDTIHGRFPHPLELRGDELFVGNRSTKICSESVPENLPWAELGVDLVVESTGRFTQKEALEKHLQAGARRVVLSAPAKGAGVPTFVMGVNHTSYVAQEHKVVSNASCTTNCLAPIVKVLLDKFGIEEGLMTTVHAMTSSQPSVDGPTRKDWRGGRAAGQNIIPSSTGAAKAVGLCIPEVQGKLTGMAFRVPVADVSCVDLTVRLSTSTSYEAIVEAMVEASQGPMEGVLGVTFDPVVSADFIGSSYSSIFDVHAGLALNDRFFKLISWYDNEVGYSERILDLVEYIENQVVVSM